ncbi:MAG TPA: enoyl-CoA hydratase/isomerase family protein [Acidimicrobiales bacterium]|jgi:enoyl-CoA hydratase/carnithine racemase|nr:enoyl-CoA hydratase/isomerase family protein [Acidimicrobiales bacterium]
MDVPDLDTVTVELDGPVGHLWLDRPDKLNPLSTATLEELVVAARWFDAQRGARVVVVGGRGRAFSAGADVGSFGEPAEGSPREAADAGRRMADAVEAMEAVTVARIHGHCVGGGVVLAAACDLRVAAEGTRFSIPEVDLGIPLAWGGIPRLVREVGPAATKELVMTCRAFSAGEAERLGLVNRVVAPDDLDDEVEGLARSLASKAAFPVRATKRHVDAVTSAMVGIDRSWSDADALLTALRDPDCRAAGARYLEALGRRRP